MATMNLKQTITVSCLCLAVLAACNSKIVYSEYRTFTEQGWSADKPAEFELDITETQQLNNVSLMIRHADDYPYRNIFLFVTTRYPDGKIMKDTMEVVLSNQKGEWMGSGAGDIFDFKVPIKKNVRFALPGHYKFSFEQAMRVDPLPQILDFGFEIEKSN